MGRMAATEFGADWVIHNDADEFWWPIYRHAQAGAGRGSRSSFGAVVAPRTEFVGRPDRPGLVRRAAGGPRGALEPSAQGGAPRRSGRRGAPPGGPRRRRGERTGTCGGRCGPRAARSIAASARSRTSQGDATRTFGSSGRRPGRFASSTSRCAPSSSSAGARRSRCSHGGFRDTRPLPAPALALRAGAPRGAVRRADLGRRGGRGGNPRRASWSATSGSRSSCRAAPIRSRAAGRPRCA